MVEISFDQWDGGGGGSFVKALLLFVSFGMLRELYPLFLRSTVSTIGWSRILLQSPSE